MFGVKINPILAESPEKTHDMCVSTTSPTEGDINSLSLHETRQENTFLLKLFIPPAEMNISIPLKESQRDCIFWTKSQISLHIMQMLLHNYDTVTPTCGYIAYLVLE